jgi:hypothetical protein
MPAASSAPHGSRVANGDDVAEGLIPIDRVTIRRRMSQERVGRITAQPSASPSDYLSCAALPLPGRFTSEVWTR